MEIENPQRDILAVINKVLEFSNEGKQAKAQHILPFVYQSVMQFPQLFWNTTEVWKVAKTLLIMHHYDLIEDEDEELRMLQMAFVFAQRGIELCEQQQQTNSQDYFNALHTQAILLSSCADYFANTITELCSATVLSADERTVALRLANKILPVLAYNVVVKIDDNFENFNGDEYLAELCNQFETENPDVTPKQLEDATKIHKMMIHTYLQFFKQ